MVALFEFLIPGRGQLPLILALAGAALMFWAILAVYRSGYRVPAVLALPVAAGLDVPVLMAMVTFIGQPAAAALPHYTGRLSIYLSPWIAVLGCFAAGTVIQALTRRLGTMGNGMVYGLLFVVARIGLYYLEAKAQVRISELQWGLQYIFLLPSFLLIVTLVTFPLAYLTPPYESQRCAGKTYWVALAGLAVLLLTGPAFASSYIRHMLMFVGIYAIAVYGLNILTGLCGQASAAQMTLCGIGAYAVGILGAKLGFPVYYTLPLAGLCGGLAALLLGLFSFLKTSHLATLTVIFSAIVMPLAIKFENLTRGARGMVFSGRNPEAAYYTTAAILIAVIVLYDLLLRSRLGRDMAAVREGQRQSFFAVYPLRLMAFTLSGFLAGISGGLFAFAQGLIHPTGFGYWINVELLIMLVIGAMGTRLGPVAGVAFIQLLHGWVFRKLDMMSANIYVFPVLAVCAAYACAYYFRIRTLRQAVRPAAGRLEVPSPGPSPHPDGQAEPTVV
jgi:branched-chain amino acid transport system permease protein